MGTNRYFCSRVPATKSSLIWQNIMSSQLALKVKFVNAFSENENWPYLHLVFVPPVYCHSCAAIAILFLQMPLNHSHTINVHNDTNKSVFYFWSNSLTKDSWHISNYRLKNVQIFRFDSIRFLLMSLIFFRYKVNFEIKILSLANSIEQNDILTQIHEISETQSHFLLFLNSDVEHSEVL